MTWQKNYKIEKIEHPKIMLGGSGKIWKKNETWFFTILHFWAFWPPKWPPNSNLTWSAQHTLGVPNFFFFDLFCQGAPNALKFHSKYIFRSFCDFDYLSLGYFIFSQIFLLSAFISMLQVFEQSPFLFSFHFLSWPCSDASLPSLSAPLTNFLLLSGNGGIFLYGW